MLQNTLVFIHPSKFTHSEPCKIEIVRILLATKMFKECAVVFKQISKSIYRKFTVFCPCCIALKEHSSGLRMLQKIAGPRHLICNPYNSHPKMVSAYSNLLKYKSLRVLLPNSNARSARRFGLLRIRKFLLKSITHKELQ